MSGPPENIPPADLWTAITKIPRPFRIVDFPRNMPGTDTPVGKLAIVILSQEEQMEAAASAAAIARKYMKDGAPKKDEAQRAYDDIYSNAAAVELLFRSCKRHDDLTRGLFPTPHDIRNSLSVDEVGVLTSMYLQATAELGPIVSRLSDEEVDAWVARLVEGGSSLPLGFMTSDALSTLAFGLALRVASYMTATTSLGTPPEDTSTESAPSDPPKVE